MGDGPEYLGAVVTEESLGRDGLVAAIVVLVGGGVAALVRCGLCCARVRCTGLPADVDVWVVEVGADGAEPVVEDGTVWVEACVVVDPPHAVSPLAANRVTISDQRVTANRGRRELCPMSIVASNPTCALPRYEHE
ncbi:MAG: hypothetical protein M3071_02000 [Actinomycetota bacterium]|nr:hypothetical protein [Actinomycetota bacterium]